jgi:hypothetical protein
MKKDSGIFFVVATVARRWKTANALRSIHALATVASAPVKAIELSGASPDRGIRYVPVVYGNCVFNRKSGEQPETNEQSVTLRATRVACELDFGQACRGAC